MPREQVLLVGVAHGRRDAAGGYHVERAGRADLLRHGSPGLVGIAWRDEATYLWQDHSQPDLLGCAIRHGRPHHGRDVARGEAEVQDEGQREVGGVSRDRQARGVARGRDTIDDETLVAAMNRSALPRELEERGGAAQVFVVP
jgi:hypothetical protein